MTASIQKKSLFALIVKSRGIKIGKLTPEQFRSSEQVPSSMFLQEAVQKWNDWKAEIGEPERISIEIA
jgi:redox-regulated HSP33 family molecular chaperone